ncbi:DotU family type VI secretion system protein [Roseateles sp. SL47]|uniref:DotU family type VI secretion system protein n=1 Tax=Roseateles sp. SL47 TaxID=2995138 RepID=UPI00226ECC41|nr:DotU family type VI secretion system protein [Roseateles sp. SL47]WAC71424.1 DotU family type VI secretion system protein [Roseateles sp. SL47]
MDPSALNDPFAGFDDQRTFIKPRPGGAAPARQVNPDGSSEPPPETEAKGLNALLSLANKLLLLVPPLRATRRVDDPAALRNQLAQGIRDFAAQAQAAGIAPERIMATRYVLCTMIDEAAADTPWGGSGVWARHSLLSMFHNETWGGEKVFQLMARLAENPNENRDLLEVIYAALTLGFEGRYRVIDNGRAQLEAVRDRLAQILKQQRGDYAPALAQHWQVEATKKRRHLGWLPLAALTAVVALVLAATYLALTLSLAERSDPVFGQIQSLRLSPPVVAPPAPPAKPRLAQFLQSDIKAGLVAVRDEVDRSVVTLRGDGLFAGGSATLSPDREPLMLRIADALSKVQGQVLVTGHSDNQPIRSARFPSNWHLSEERAHTVAQLLMANQVSAERVRAEGRADAEPVAPNDTPANRALNRRVEISLMIGGRADAAQAASGAAR